MIKSFMLGLGLTILSIATLADGRSCLRVMDAAMVPKLISDAYNRGDFFQLKCLYARDVQLIGAEGAIVRGNKNVGNAYRFFKNEMKIQRAEFRAAGVEYSKDQKQASIYGTWEDSMNSPKRSRGIFTMRAVVDPYLKSWRIQVDSYFRCPNGICPPLGFVMQ